MQKSPILAENKIGGEVNSLSRAELGSYSIYRCFRRCYSTSDQSKRINNISLEKILEEDMLQKPVIWQKLNVSILKADLGEGITAHLFPGAEEHNTSISVSNGVESISCEIAEYFLENWSVGEKASEKK